MPFYCVSTDENGVQLVEQLDTEHVDTLDEVGALADMFPETNYFEVPSPIENILRQFWKTKSDGRGSWGILSLNNDVIADDMPYGSFAEHLVELHNSWVDEGCR